MKYHNQNSVILKLMSQMLAFCYIFSATLMMVNAYNSAYSYDSSKITGNQIEDIIYIAETQVGYTYNNGTAYGAWYGNTKGDWCAMFISWCANKAGIPTTIIPKTAGAGTFRNQAGTYHFKDSYTPKRGDIVLFNPINGSYYWPSKDSSGKYAPSSHVAIVRSYDSSTKKISVVHGNWENQVKKSTFSVSSTAIQAFVTPNYSSSTQTKPTIATDFNPTIKNGIYTLKCAHSSGKMLNVYDGSNSCVNGTKLTTWSKDGSNDQKFYFKYVSSGKYLIYAVCSGVSGTVYKRVVDVNVGSNNTLELGYSIDVCTHSDSMIY